MGTPSVLCLAGLKVSAYLPSLALEMVAVENVALTAEKRLHRG